jgi:hypothetical protein
MARGRRSEVGEKRTSQNGYVQIRTENGWKALHRVLAEEKLGRPLAEGERVTFADGDPSNCTLENVMIYPPKWRSNRQLEIERLNDQIEKMTERRDYLLGLQPEVPEQEL